VIERTIISLAVVFFRTRFNFNAALIVDRCRLAASPEYYPAFVELKAVPSLLSLMSHENTGASSLVLPACDD
jgi:hypothetical protein